MQNSQCEAILSFESRDGANPPGSQCPEVGSVPPEGGPCVCWVHLQAARNPVRKERLTFVSANVAAAE